MKKLKLTFLCLLACLYLQAQSVVGTIVDQKTKEPLIGASVVCPGMDVGTVTDIDGKFKLNVETDKLEISYIGYEKLMVDVSGKSDLGMVSLSPDRVSLDAVTVVGVIDIAEERKTPVAVSTISAREIQMKLGNQEFPEIMKTTPSIYVTKTGGGYGDARINVRGFDQTNTAYIINGQPINDMENGRVFWSNWSGLQDIASSIQIQRGIGASKLAVPSVGGTVNIVTKSTDREAGGFANVAAGNDGYLKTTISYGTGELENGFSASILLGRWQGDGYVDGTKGEGYNYLAALGYNAGGGHMLNFSFLGAGQWHHQRSLNLSIRDFQNFGGEDFRKFNGDWGYLNGEEYTFRRNFYNKPIASLNWDWEISENTTIGAVLYGSWGRGGGTGPRGRNFGINPFREDLTSAMEGDGLPFRTEEGLIDFDAVVENNASTLGYTGAQSEFNGLKVGSNGFNEDNVNSDIAIRRSSINSHNWYGAIANLKHKINNLTFGLGLDGRIYSGLHYRIVNDLLGLDAYYSSGDDNNDANIVTEETAARPFVGIDKEDKIDYYNIGNVSWLGVNGMAEYSTESVTAVVQAGLSNQSYQREDFFSYSGAEQQSETHTQLGGFVKGGVNYNVDESNNVFFNAGHILRQPNFDAIFPNFGNTINPDIENEKITSFELGYGCRMNNFNVNVNLYTTSWTNRNLTRGVTLENGDDGTAFFKNLANIHSGIEIDARLGVHPKVDLIIMSSFGNWRYNGNVDGQIFDENQEPTGATKTLYLEDVKVGDAAQTTVSLGIDYQIIKGLSFDASYNYFDRLYADFDPVRDEEFDSPENKGAIQLPSYGLVDVGLSYNLNIGSDKLLTLRANVNNLLDTEYIAESNTNFHREFGGKPSYKGILAENNVWWGFGRTWNVSAKFSF